MEQTVRVTYESMIVEAVYGDILECIQTFKDMDQAKRLRIYDSIQSTLAKGLELVKTDRLTPLARQNLCNDIVCAVAADFVMHGTPIPITLD